MYIPNSASKGVAFIGSRWTDRERFYGTGFFIFRQVPGTDKAHIYLITAKHVIDAASKKAMDDEIIIRHNTPTGVGTTATYLKDWVFHSTDASVDVAICLPPLHQNMDFVFFPSAILCTPELIERESIGAGTPVFITGMLSSHLGNIQNISVIRTGCIAALPEEKIPSKLGPIDAYLIETHSTGGLSGSPVFVTYYGEPDATRWDGKPRFLLLLGLIHGHYNEAVPHSSEMASVNAGIALVVPARKIEEVLNEPALLEKRGQRPWVPADESHPSQ